MRYHATANGNVPFTPEEEAEFDAMAAASKVRPNTAVDVIHSLSPAETTAFIDLLKSSGVIDQSKTDKLKGGKR